MAKENFYDQITEQYYDFMQEMKKLTPSEILSKSELIATTKKVYKFISTIKPFDEDEISVLSQIKKPLEVLAEMYEDVNDIDAAVFDRMMWEGMSRDTFADMINE